jgi:hypothetical protein
VFDKLNKFLFGNAIKNVNTCESVTIVIENIGDNRNDMTLSFTNYYLTHNFDKYKTIYIMTLFPKPYLFIISQNTIENYIDVLLNIRYCEAINMKFFSEIKLQPCITEDTFLYVFSDRGLTCIPKIYLTNGKQLQPVIERKKIDYLNNQSAELTSYKDALVGKYAHKIEFKSNSVKFYNGSNQISYSGNDHEFFMAQITNNTFCFVNSENFVASLDNEENQKKLFSCMLLLYMKYNAIPNYISDVIESGLNNTQLLNPKYNSLKNELKKYLHRHKCMKSIIDEIVNSTNKIEIILTNKNSEEFYKIQNNSCVGLCLNINTTNSQYNGTCIDLINIIDGKTTFIPVQNYFDELKEKKYIHKNVFLNQSNFVLPIYLNNLHWKASQPYIKKIFEIVFTKASSNYSENMMKFYYHALTYYSRGMFFTKNIVNWDVNWINCWLSLFHTCYHISLVNNYHKGFQKYISKMMSINNLKNYSTIFGQMISINYKNPVPMYNIIESIIVTKLIHHIDNTAVGLKELIEENDPNLNMELENAMKTIHSITHAIESYIAILFTLSMIKDILGGISELCKELDESDGFIETNTSRKLYDYCETFRELPIENKIQILVNKKRIPIDNIFQLKTLCKKIKYHYSLL